MDHNSLGDFFVWAAGVLGWPLWVLYLVSTVAYFVLIYLIFVLDKWKKKHESKRTA
jgi:membrane protein YqaA with SNARE-associated domain